MWRYAATFLHFGFLLTCFHLLPRLPHFHPGWIPAQMHIKFFVLLLPRACNTESLHLMTWFLHTEPLLGIAWLQLCDGQWGQGVPNRSNIFKYIVPNILLCRAWMLFFIPVPFKEFNLRGPTELHRSRLLLLLWYVLQNVWSRNKWKFIWSRLQY